MLKQPAQLRLGLWLVGLMWVLPFLSFNHHLPIPSFYGELTAAALGLAAIAVLLRKEGWQPFELPRIALLPLGLVTLVLLQFLFGKIVFAQQALLGMLYLLWAMLLMALGSRLRRELGWEAFAVTLAWFLLAGGVLSAAVTLLQFVGWQGTLLVPKRLAQSYGNLGQSNHFADYMALALAALIYLRAKGRIMLLPFWMAAGGFLVVLALSGSRSSWFYLLALTLLGLAVFRSERTDSNRRLLRECLALLPAFLLLQQVTPWLSELAGAGAMLTPTERLFREVSGTGVRLQIWHEAWQMFVGAPWLGVGFGQFDWHSFVLAERQVAGAFAEPTEHAHNLFLHLMAEMGMFAGLLCLLLPGLWLMRNWRRPLALEWWWLMALLAIVGIHSMLEYPLWYTYFLGIAAVLLGAGEQRMLRLELAGVGRPALAAMLLLGGMGLVNLTQSYTVLEFWMQRGMQGQVRDSELPAISRDLLRVHKESLLAPYVELVLSTSIEPNHNLLQEKLQLSAAAMHFSPIRTVVYRHALLLALNGEREAARRQLQRAIAAYPRDVPQFIRELRAMIANSPGSYEFLLAEVLAKEQV